MSGRRHRTGPGCRLASAETAAHESCDAQSTCSQAVTMSHTQLQSQNDLGRRRTLRSPFRVPIITALAADAGCSPWPSDGGFSLVEVVAEHLGAGGMAQLGHRLGFDLPDTLSGNRGSVSHPTTAVRLPSQEKSGVISRSSPRHSAHAASSWRGRLRPVGPPSVPASRRG